MITGLLSQRVDITSRVSILSSKLFHGWVASDILAQGLDAPLYADICRSLRLIFSHLGHLPISPLLFFLRILLLHNKAWTVLSFSIICARKYFLRIFRLSRTEDLLFIADRLGAAFIGLTIASMFVLV
jgi:hypothetical protein